MEKKMLLLAFIVASHISFAQGQKKSFPPDVDKIDSVKSSYRGCIRESCYSWWSIALRHNHELLAQTGAHHPAGARTKYFSIGTWRISGDILKLNIDKASLDTVFMRTDYRIGSLYSCEILIPIDSTDNGDVVLQDIKLKFEQTSDYLEFREFENPELLLSRSFKNFVQFHYSTDKKILIER